MSDEFQDDDDLSNEEEESQVMKTLRKQAREGKQAAAERDAAVRELAFAKAGVPDTVATGYFTKAYDGALDVESIRTAATEAGFIQATESEQAEQVDDDEREAHERTAAAETGSSDTEPPGYAEAVAGAKNQAELIAVMEKYNRPLTNH